MYLYCQIFLVGILECFLLSLNAKFLQRGKRMRCFITSFINALVWFWVISLIIDNIKNGKAVLIYGLGFGIGDVLAISVDEQIDKVAKARLFKSRRLKRKRRKK